MGLESEVENWAVSGMKNGRTSERTAERNSHTNEECGGADGLSACIRVPP